MYPPFPTSWQMVTRSCITFPAPSLKFRTSGFPQYGFKRVFSHDLRSCEAWGKREVHMLHTRTNLYLAKAAVSGSCGRFRHVKRSRIAPSADPSRGPWLAGGLCCPAGSRLTTASSATLAASRRLIFFVPRVFALRPRMGWRRELPQFTLRVCSFVPPPLPRGSGRLHATAPSPPALAFALPVRGSANPAPPSPALRWTV
jgi:hypothetical protein